MEVNIITLESECVCKMGFRNNFNITNNLVQTELVTQRCIQCPDVYWLNTEFDFFSR